MAAPLDAIRMNSALLTADASPARRRAAADTDLCAWAQEGSPAAFSELADRHRGALRAYCDRLLRDDQSEDVLQQSLVKAWLALSEDRVQVANPKAWLFRIAHNQAMDHLRSRRAAPVQLDADWESPHSTERSFDARDRLDRVSAGIRELPGGQRDALLMHTIDGRSYADVAVRMGSNVPAVSQLIARARARLREIPCLLPAGFLLKRLGTGLASLGTGTKAGMLAVAVAGAAGLPVVAGEAPREPLTDPAVLPGGVRIADASSSPAPGATTVRDRRRAARGGGAEQRRGRRSGRTGTGGHRSPGRTAPETAGAAPEPPGPPPVDTVADSPLAAVPRLPVSGPGTPVSVRTPGAAVSVRVDSGGGTGISADSTDIAVEVGPTAAVVEAPLRRPVAAGPP